jgi:iron complex outermembrane receptor protein
MRSPFTSILLLSGWAEEGSRELSSEEVKAHQPITQLPRGRDLNQPATTVKEWVAQIEAQTILVTNVKLERTDAGLDIILETAEGKPLQVDATKFRTEGNSLIADIPNATLALPDDREFNADNLTDDIANVRVARVDDNSIRVSVTGKTAVPKSEVTLKTETFAYSLKPEGKEPDEEIEIVVTGERQQDGYGVPNATTPTKTDTPLRDIPQSLQVVPRQVIEDQKVTRIFDALRNVSSVTKTGGFGDSQDDFTIRGFTNFESLSNGFRIQAPIVNPTSIERIEVLKGPASVLYGQFEPGGIVNFATKQPLERPYYSGEFVAGSYNFYRPSIDLSGPLTGDAKLLYRLNAAYESAGSFVDFVDSKTFAIAPVLTYKFSDATRLTLGYEYLKVDRVFYDGFPPNPVLLELPISRFLGEPDINNLEQETNNVYLTLNHRFSENLELRSGFAAFFSDTGVRYIRPTTDLDIDGRTLFRRFIPSDTLGYSSYTVQTDLIGKFNTGSVKHQVLLGFDWNQYNYGGDYFENIAGSPIDIFNPVYGTVQPTELDSASF